MLVKNVFSREIRLGMNTGREIQSMNDHANSSVCSKSDYDWEKIQKQDVFLILEEKMNRNGNISLPHQFHATL